MEGYSSCWHDNKMSTSSQPHTVEAFTHAQTHTPTHAHPSHVPVFTHLDFVPVNKTRRLHVSTFVPLEFPDHELNSLLSRYGDIDNIVHKYFTEPGLETYDNGCRVVIFTKLDKDLPVRLTYHGVSIGFKYTGQPLSCIRCSSMEHVVKNCPIQRRNRRPNITVNRPESEDRDSTAPEPTTTTMETDPPTTKPAETPKENGNNATEKPTEKTAKEKENLIKNVKR